MHICIKIVVLSLVVASVNADVFDKVTKERITSAKANSAKNKVPVDNNTWLDKIYSRVNDVRESINRRVRTTLYPKSINSRSGIGMATRLERHGPAGAVASDVANIASQQIPRSSIIEQIRLKYPKLDTYEVNDIIIAAHLHLGKDVPILKDMLEQAPHDLISNTKKIKKDNDRAPPHWFHSKEM